MPAKTETEIKPDSLEEARAFLDAAFETRDPESSEKDIRIAQVYILIDIAESFRELNDNLAIAMINFEKNNSTSLVS